ncbi:putative apocytochrome b, partial [Toxoplasma gondii TgCatPRC2]
FYNNYHLNGSRLMDLSHPDNSIPVSRFVIPFHIVPQWYFLGYYAVLGNSAKNRWFVSIFVINMSLKYQ